VGIVYPNNIDSFSEPSLPESTPLSEAGTGTRNHVEHHHDLGSAVVALEQNAAWFDHDHSGAVNASGSTLKTAHGNKLLQANTHESADTNSSAASIHHTLAVRNYADLGITDANIPVNGWKAAAANHVHDFNGPSILNQPLRMCTSTTRPSNPAFGTMIYETDSNIVRVWAKIGRNGMMAPDSDGTPYWQILPVANIPFFQAESRINQELIPVYPNNARFTHVLSDFIWSATGIQRFMEVTSNETRSNGWTYVVRAANNGNYRLTYNGVTTPNIAWNASDSTVRSTLATALSTSESNIVVTKEVAGPNWTTYTNTYTVVFGSAVPVSTLVGGNLSLSGAIDTALLGPFAINPNTQYYGQYTWPVPPSGGTAINIPEPGLYEVRSTIHWHPDRTYHDQSMIAIFVNNVDIGKKTWEFMRGPFVPSWLAPNASLEGALPGFAQTSKLEFSWRFAAGDTLRVVVRHNGYRNSFLWYNSGAEDNNTKQVCDVAVKFRSP
jgi:hypothetical protein